MIMVTRKTSLLRPFLLASTLAAGFGTLWFVLVIWIGTSIHESWPGKSRVYPEFFVVTADGTPLVQSYTGGGPTGVILRDLNGREHSGVEGKDQLPAVSLHGEYVTPASFLSEVSWNSRIRVFLDEREPTAVWYFVHDGKPQGSGYFVGYERTGSRLIGFIGLSGFRAQSVPPDERIPVRGELFRDYAMWSSAPINIYSGYSGGGWFTRPARWDLPPRLVHVPSGNRLRLVDLNARTVATVFEAPEPIVSVGVPTISAYTEGQPRKRCSVLVRAGQKIYKLDHQYKVISTFTIPAEIDRRSAVAWHESDNGQAVAECYGPRTTREAVDGNVTRPMVYRIASDGAVRDSFDVTLQNGSPKTDEMAFFLTALSLPSPAALLAVHVFIEIGNSLEQGDLTAVGAMLKRYWPLLAAVLALSSVLAAIAWRRGRAFGLSRREQAVWAVFVLLFGVPAYAGFLLHRRWPVREPCPHCHARCPRDRDACAECGTPLPAPALKGNEIFA
jgi:hypothetical protein